MIVDFTHKIKANMQCYCDEELIDVYDIYDKNSSDFLVKRLNLTSHTGTHVDSPNHILKNSCTIDKLDISNFFGTALILDCTKFNNMKIIPKEILENINLNSVDFLFFYTGASKFFYSTKFLYDYISPSNELITLLSNENLKGIGTDCISIDSPSDHNLTNHKILFSKNKIIYECLNNLSLCLNKKIVFHGVPLNIENGDASPVRAYGTI